MILRELDLDIPNLDEHRRYEFSNEVRSVAAHYYSYLPSKFKTNGFWKILIECVDEASTSDVYLKVKVVKVAFNYEMYRKLDKDRKKKTILDTLHEGVIKACEEEGWQQDTFQHCYEQVLNDEFYFSWLFKKPKKSKNRELVAEVSCLHDFDAFTMSLEVKNLDSEIIYTEEVFSTKPNEFVFVQLLGDFKWVSNEEIEFYDKSKNCIADIVISHKT